MKKKNFIDYDPKEKPKLYTLEQAYEEILRIKNETVGKDHHTKQEEAAFRRGYAKAILDMQHEFNKRSSLLAAINVF